ncbi:MAG TPA: WD40 repeat domain-containing protein [Kofleriaceae bacterium]|nr:WD40 repeat domain-containing protein [Kofleriaceae bacterium]
MISVSANGALKVWDLDRERRIVTLEGPSDVTACAVTEDGHRAVLGTEHVTIVWSLFREREFAVLERNPYQRVTACAVTADGRRAVTVMDAKISNDFKVWDLESGHRTATLHDRNGSAPAVTEGKRRDLRKLLSAPTSGRSLCAATPDGLRVVSADGALEVWTLYRTDSPHTTTLHSSILSGHSGRVNACAMTADGRHVVSASDDRTLKVWDLSSGRVLATLEGHSGWVRACALTADDRRVISASVDRTLKVWDLESGRALTTLEGHADWVRWYAVTADGRRVIAPSASGTPTIWDLDSGHVLSTLEGHADRVLACTVTTDGRRAVSASADSTLKVWDLERGSLLSTLEGHEDWVLACTISAEGRRMVSASADTTLKVWDLENGSLLATLKGHDDWVTACTITPDGKRLISVSDDETLCIWDPESGLQIGRSPRCSGGVRWYAVVGRTCVASIPGELAGARAWDLVSGERLGPTWANSVEEDRSCRSLCAVPTDSRRMVSGSQDGTLKVWDLDRERELVTLEGHHGPVNACAVTPDGRRVVSASADRTLKVWDLATYACLFTHRGDAAHTAVAVTETVIVAGDVTGAVSVLDWPSVIATARRREPQPSSGRCVVLFLAADPGGTSRRDLEEECTAIEHALEQTPGGQGFDFRPVWVERADEVMRHLERWRPALIHFSGRGGVDGRGGVHLQGEHRSQYVSARALAQLLADAAPSARAVVLSACFDEVQAGALRDVVGCVIGTGAALGDAAVYSFSVSFYRALGGGQSVGEAVAQASAALAARQLPREQLPICQTRDGASVDQIFLGPDDTACR